MCSGLVSNHTLYSSFEMTAMLALADYAAESGEYGCMPSVRALLLLRAGDRQLRLYF